MTTIVPQGGAVPQGQAPQPRLATVDTAASLQQPWSPDQHGYHMRYDPTFSASVHALLLAHHATPKRPGRDALPGNGDDDGDGTGEPASVLGDLPVDLLLKVVAALAPQREAWRRSVLTKTLRSVRTFIRCLTVTADGQYVVSGSFDSTVNV